MVKAGSAHTKLSSRQVAELPGCQFAEIPHHGALLADPHGAAERPQPSREQHGLDHGDRHRLSRTNRAAPQQRRAVSGDAAVERLQHCRLREVARNRGLGGQPVRPDRSLADAFGLRQVLRLHRRRDQNEHVHVGVVVGHNIAHAPHSPKRQIGNLAPSRFGQMDGTTLYPKDEGGRRCGTA
jgi:hypothetical protein